MSWSSENEACSSILDFLHWLNYRVRSSHEKTVAVVYSLDNTQEVTSCFAASSVRYLRMELMRFSS